ncbi:MAG: NADPH-dependent FMN reductase [Gammaproteobacteria bacterium]|nr:MAG: NADPH-dependent FMN reductase [Gammaproteobacteria bacterium]
MKILAFAASSSRKSINKQLISYASRILLEDDINQHENKLKVEILDLNDVELPLFSEDREAELGQPQLAKDFLAKIGESDAVIISFAEHNGSYTVAYKNIFDWASRINPKVFQNKPMLLLATSPGPGGASNVLAMATNSAPYFDGEVIASFSLPSFYENFDSEQGRITNEKLNNQLKSALDQLTVSKHTLLNADKHQVDKQQLDSQQAGSL